MIHKIRTSARLMEYYAAFEAVKLITAVTGKVPENLFKLSAKLFFRFDALLREKFDPDEDYEEIAKEWKSVLEEI